MILEENDLLNELNIEGTIKYGKSKNNAYILNVKGTRFINPVSCHYAFLLGLGDDRHKTCLGDDRYKLIESYILKNIIPNMRATTGGGYMMSSYGLKHIIENAIGGYVSNETVKFIMAYHESTYVHAAEPEINVIYPMSKRWVKKHSILPREDYL